MSQIAAVFAFCVIVSLVSCRNDAPPRGPADAMKEGVAAVQRKNLPAGIAHFRKVIAEDPAHYGANYQLANALDASGKRQEARRYWEKVLGMARQAGDEETIRTAKARLTFDEQADRMQAGIDLLYKKSRPADAAAEFTQVLHENPSHYGALYQLAAAYDRTGRRDEGRLLWEKVLRSANESRDEVTASTASKRLAEK